jgi:hypothetical protein
MGVEKFVEVQAKQIKSYANQELVDKIEKIE